MVITEDMLAPFRRDHGHVVLNEHPRWGNKQVPDHWFEHTDDIFDSMPPSNDRPPVVVVLAFTDRIPKLNQAYEWRGLMHQSGGHACHNRRMVATTLDIRRNVRSYLEIIAADFYGALSGHFDHGQMIVSVIPRYVRLLSHIGLDCEATWRHLEEAVYPVDATQSNLDIIANNAPKIVDLADWQRGPPARYSDSPCIFVLSANSD